jgi:hypothetical protein
MIAFLAIIVYLYYFIVEQFRLYRFMILSKLQQGHGWLSADLGGQGRRWFAKYG